MPITETPVWGGSGSAGSPDTPDQIKNKLETLIGSDRLDASAIQNLPNLGTKMLGKIVEIATAAGYTNGNAFTFAEGNDFLGTIGAPATFEQTVGRAFPLYYSTTNNVGFFGGDGTDPTVAGTGLLVFKIPKEYFTESQELRITTIASSSGGTRQLWAYNGDATASGTPLILTRGNLENTSQSATHTRFFDIPASSSDIYLYSSRQIILDIDLPNKAARYGAVLAGTKIAAAAAFASAAGGYVHGTVLSQADANASVLGMGVNATWRITNGRVMPRMYISGDRYGFFTSGINLDPTGDVAISELIIPRGMLQDDMVLDILRESTSGAGAGQRIQVFAGDPTAFGTKLTPLTGTEDKTSNTMASRTTWNVTTTPGLNDKVPFDLHICFMNQAVFSVDLVKVLEHVAVATDLDELRGGSRAAEFDATQFYAKGTIVYLAATDREYIANVDHAINDAWDITKWNESSIRNNATGNLALNDTTTVLRGAEAYPTYAETGVDYSTDDFVFEPTTNKNWKAKIAIADPAGVFDATNWFDASLAGSVEADQQRDLLTSLSDDNRLDVSAIKNIHNGSKSLQGNLKQLATDKGLVNGSALDTNDVAGVFESLGVSDVVATGTWFIYIGAGNSVYSIGATSGAITIPRSEFLASREVLVTFRRRTNSGNRDVRVTVAGSLILPTMGSSVNIYNNYADTRWDIPQQPTGDVAILARDVIIGGIYLVDPLFSKSTTDVLEVRGDARPAAHNTSTTYAFGQRCFYNTYSYTCNKGSTTGAFLAADWDKTSVFDNNDRISGHDTDIVEIRGGDTAAEFSAAATYNAGDFVYRTSTNREYCALVNIVAGNWNDAEWDESSTRQLCERNRLLEAEVLSNHDEIDSNAGYEKPNTYSATSSYTVGQLVHEPTSGQNFQCHTDTPAPAGLFNETLWQSLSLVGLAEIVNVRDRLQRLAGTERLASGDIQFLESFQSVYVTNSGDDTNDGRSIESPVATLHRAEVIAALLPNTSHRAIVCHDSSVFVEDIAPAANIHFLMPVATITGSVITYGMGSNLYDIGTITGAVTLGKEDHIKVINMEGSITTSTATDTHCVVEVCNYLSGNLFISTGSDGFCKVKIDRIYPAFTLTNNSVDIVLSGWYGATILGGLQEAPVDGKQYARQDAAWSEVTAASGGTGHNFANINFTSVAGGWVDIIVWDTLAAGTFDSYGADFIMYLQDAATGEFVTQRVSLNGSFGAVIDDEHHFIGINGRVSTLTASIAGATYRVIQETDDPRSPIHLQVRTSLDGINYVGISASQLSLDYAPTTQVFPWTYYTVTGSERILSEEITDRWDELNIYDGFNGGISAESIGSPTGLGSRLRFLNDKIEHYIGNSKTLESFADGTLISGSSGTTISSPRYVYSVTNASPDLVAAGTEFGDMSVDFAPIGATWSLDLQGAYSGAAVPGWASAGSSETMVFTVDPAKIGVLRLSNVSVTLELDLVTGSAGGSFSMVDSDGNTVDSGNLPVPQEKGEYFRRTFTFPTDGILTLTKGTTGFVGVPRGQLNVIEAEVDKSGHLVLDLHSNTRAFGLPKAIDVGLTPFEDGNLRAHPTDGRPQVFKSGDWSEIPATRFKVNATSHIASYYADLAGGDYLAQGCEEAPRPADLTVVNGQYGYPTLLNIIDASSSQSGVLARNFDTAFETSMRDNGFEWTTNYRHDVGLMYLWLHVGTTYDGTAGRWLVNLTRSGNDVIIAAVSGGGGSITVPADKVIKYVFRCEAGSSTANLYIDGVFAFTVGKQANTSYSSGRWEITSGSSASTDEVGYILSTTLYSSNNPTVTLTRDEVESSVSLIIPSSPLPVDVIVPKGTYTVGTTLTVSGNGDVLRAEADDPQSFDDQPKANVDGNITYTQTDFPRGNNWRSDSKKATTIHSKGNTLFITVNAAGVLQSRHGTYLNGITISKVTTGIYTVLPTDIDGHVFDITSTYIGATSMNASGGVLAEGEFVVGEPTVNTKAMPSGADVDSDFSMALMW